MEIVSFPLDILTDFFMTTAVKQIYSDGSGRDLASYTCYFIATQMMEKEEGKVIHGRVWLTPADPLC